MFIQEGIMPIASEHHIVIVGGGAGGLELATQLGKKLGKHKHARITLLDSKRTHIWKPLLHEVAAGTFDSYENQVEYMAQGKENYFEYRLGRIFKLDHQQQIISVAPTLNKNNEEIIPQRQFHYDTLIMAVGSVSNDFGIEGVQDHCLFLDTKQQAQSFQNQLLETYIKANTQTGEIKPGQLDVVIAGAGATGVELSAQLYKVSRLFTAYGLDQLNPSKLKFIL
jgi:NADH:quinone reductase (non-electrogenic)